MPRAFALSEFYDCYNQASAIDFVNTTIDRLAFSIRRYERTRAMSFRPYSTGKSRTWAFATPKSNQGRRDSTARLSGHHRTDQQEFYQCLIHTDDVDLRVRLLEPIQEELESDESVVILCSEVIWDRSTRCGSLNTA
jgi:hypothetical protein